MRRTLTLLILSTPFVTLAQPYLPTFNSTDTATIQCPQDTSVSILSYTGWEAYQTTDDTWWGPRDTNVCINLAHIQGQWVYPRIAVDEIDATRPVFLRARYDDNNVLPLSTNDQYAFSFQAYGVTPFDAGSCPGGPCTGLFAGVRIPDSAGTGTDMRWYQAAYDDQGFSQYPLQVCVPTEKFAQNDLREFIASFKLINPLAGSYIEYLYSEVQDFEQWGSLVRLTSSNLPQYQWSQFSYGIGSGWENVLVMHDNLEYPDFDHVFYLDVPAAPNVVTPTPITLSLEPYTGFNFQPHTQLRGGLVLGSDSIRHPLAVVNNGADLCMGWEFIEVVWPGGSEYVHHSGHVSFQGRNSCFQFQPGSTLRVADGSTFYYGSNGRGFLLMIEGSQLSIGHDAELVINGAMIIKESPDVAEERDTHITLGAGARLRFAPGSSLINAWSNGGAMKLVVTLDGGSIDITGLSPEDREKVVVIELPTETLTTMQLMGNVVSDLARVSFASRIAGTVELRVVDHLGRSVIERNGSMLQGANVLELSLAGLPGGHYILSANTGTEQQVLRFVKQ